MFIRFKSFSSHPFLGGSTTTTSALSPLDIKSSTTSVKVTAAEKKLLELYRAADTETRKAALKALKGEDDGSDSLLEDILGVVQDMLIKK